MSRIVDFKEIELKWQKRWEEARIFEADPDYSRPKCFVTFPYPYMNGPLHLGHAYTCMKVDVYARFKRMRGYNVLFPQGWHATGEPIQGVAERVKKGDPIQIKILRESGVPSEEIKKFTEPKYIVEFYVRKARKDMRRIGFSIDWRREFVTTTLCPPYSRFIEWQYNTLRKKGYVYQGTHPVIWCPHCQSPTGDHDRLEGEGVSPVEVVLIKFKYENGYIVVATFRPETIFGVTNIWVNPEATYVEAEVDGEIWYISKDTVIKLKDQLRKVEVLREFKGSELVGKKCVNPMRGDEVYILPASFVDPKTGTGVVMSVPSHAPYDYLALRDLEKHPGELRKYGIDPSILSGIEPISIIKVEGYGDHPAVEVVERLRVESQNDFKKADEATKEVYKKEFHLGVMKENCGKYSGMKVSEAKEKIAEDLRSKGYADTMWDPADIVICRCTTRCHVKILENQWFLKYGDPEWKKTVKEHLAKMKIFPEEARQAFEATIDWLNDKPCARKTGLGTPLPWDPEWIVETLSDSVIYMAYYTIAKHINQYKIPAEKLTDEVFDYIFLGKGDLKDVAAKSGLDPKLLEEMRREFEYWYPVDLRNSAKELIYNHLTFFIFQHIAIFRPEHWPRAIGANGMIMVEGRKMSKRYGNFITMEQILEKYGADVSRFALAYCGEGLEDPDWRIEEVEAIRDRLAAFYDMAIKLSKQDIDDEWMEIDRWLVSRMQHYIEETTKAIEELKTRTALQQAFFNSLNDIKWYLRRRGKPGPAYREALETIVKLVTPFIPHLAEEIWEKWGRKPFISTAPWPKPDKSKVDSLSEEIEDYIMSLHEDISEILRVTKIEKPSKIILFVAPEWKYIILREAIKDTKDLIKRVMQIPEVRKHGKEAAKYATSLIKTKPEPTLIDSREKELLALSEAKDFLEKEYGCEVEIVKAEESAHPKAKVAAPLKPGIFVEA
ncbi:MAG TPA: leucine--tRNA ligase [Thermoprotei archaeon]|nr:leucine--tRNA ligase [Thermoprotei archaeon]